MTCGSHLQKRNGAVLRNVAPDDPEDAPVRPSRDMVLIPAKDRETIFTVLCNWDALSLHWFATRDAARRRTIAKPATVFKQGV
jgi:hypothetical protein